MQILDDNNTNSLRKELDGRQVDCQIKILVKELERLQEEIKVLKDAREKDYERFSGDICDHGRRLKRVETDGGAGYELQQKAIKLAEYMADVKVAKFSELRGKFNLSKYQLNRVVEALMERYPLAYEIARNTTDKRERKLIKRPVL